MATSKRKRLGSADWRARVAQQAASGLSAAAFCARHGLHAASFYQWRTRLRADAVGSPPREAHADPGGAFVDLGTLAMGASRLELRLDLGGGLLLQLSRG